MRKKIKGLKKEMGGDGSGCKGLVGDVGQRGVVVEGGFGRRWWPEMCIYIYTVHFSFSP